MARTTGYKRTSEWSMTQRDEGHNFRDSKNKLKDFKNRKVERIELGEVTYKFSEIFNTPEEATNKTKQGDEPKFTMLEQKIERVNIKPIEKESNIEHRGKDVRPKKDSAIEKSTERGSKTNE